MPLVQRRELGAVVAADAAAVRPEPQGPRAVQQDGLYGVVGQTVCGGETSEIPFVVAADAATAAEPEITVAVLTAWLIPY